MLSKLATFAKCDIPVKFPASMLASRGYIYHPTKCVIQCSGCHFVLEMFNDNVDSSNNIHQAWAPNCPYSSPETSLHRENARFDGLRLDELLQKMISIGGLMKVNNGGISENNIVNILTLSDMKLDDMLPRGVNPAFRRIIESMICRAKKRETSKTGHHGSIARTDVSNGLSNDITGDDETLSNTATVPFRLLPNITIGDLLQGSKHPALIGRDARKQTFIGKEKKYSHCRVTIVDFVEAGFFYVGPQDSVRCFFCDGGLKNFKAEDDPWVEHKKWFAQCKYVMYRDNLMLRRDTVDGSDRPGNALEGNLCREPLFNPKKVLEARELKARLELPIIQELIRRGYQRDHIRQSIERRFAVAGEDYTTVLELVNDIITHEGHEALPVGRQNTESMSRTQLSVQVSDEEDLSDTVVLALSVRYRSNIATSRPLNIQDRQG